MRCKTMDDENFVDINKKVFLAPETKDEVKENKEALTKEGIEVKLKNWLRSNNKYMIKKYGDMLKNCKNVRPSGKTIDGRVIYSRPTSGRQWTSKKGE